jgi:RHS repeat-associated protein
MARAPTEIHLRVVRESNWNWPRAVTCDNQNASYIYNYIYDAVGNVANDGVDGFPNGCNCTMTCAGLGSWQGSQVLAEHNGSTGAVPIDYVYSGSQMIAKVASGSTQYFLSDRLSVRLSLDSGGNIVGRQGHLPFGEDFGESGSQDKHHFTSYERDGESASDYAVNRQYGQNVGRFMRVDALSGLISLPQSLNRYSYVTNNPVNAFDRLGLMPIFAPNLPICPVINGVARCGSLGAISVNAGLGGGQSAGGGGSGSDGEQLLTEGGPNAGNETGDGETETPEDPMPLNPCEKKVALLHSNVPFWPWLLDAWRRADNWEKEATGGKTSDDDWINAVKHCIWSCEMTKHAGFDEAAKWGDAHECDDQGNPKDDGSDSSSAKSSRMDQHNNEAGRFYGSKFPKQDCKENCKTDTYGRLQTSP